MTQALGTWAEVFGDASPQAQQLALRLRELIRVIHPSSVEVAWPGYNAVSFGHGHKKMSEAYVYLAPHGERVNLGFYQGAHLADPTGIMEGTGKAMRHVKVRDLALAESAAVEVLIRQAVGERLKHFRF